MAGASSRVFLVALVVASFAIAPPALAADSGEQAQASAPRTHALQGSASVSSVSSAPRGGTWGSAELVPGTAALDGGGWAGVGGLSCTSPGDCTAAGFYSTSQQVEYAFTASQANGSWGRAVPAPGIPGIGGGAITIASMSCVSAGNCAAGGSFYGNYSTNYDTADAFVMSESGGTWGSAEDLSNLGLGNDNTVQVTSVSCPAAGDCVAAGSYQNAAQIFVVDETNGTWGAAQQISGTNLGSYYGTPQVACVSVGNCFVTVSDYVAAETNGTWGAAEVLPAGMTAMALSCVPGGDCTIGGAGSTDPAVVTEVGGTWGTPVPVAHNLDVGQGNAEVTSLSCTSGGNCGAVGFYSNDLDESEPFVVNEVNGNWETAEAVQQSFINVATMSGISCASAGNCSAISSDAAFVVNEVNGTWGSGQQIPGAVGLSAAPTSISCPAAGFCAVSGQSDNQAFVANEATATTTTLSLSAAKVPYRDEKAEHLSVTVASKAGGTPNGVVTIAEDSATICTVTLSAGRGSCTLPTTRFSIGAYRVTASYPGAAQFLPSAASAKTLTVTKAQTVTRIALSAGSVKFGHENSLHISVSVSPQYGGAPSGKVTVKAGNTAICAITLKSEKGTCTLTARKLNVGSYAVTATFGGNADFLPSVSARKTLRITR